MVIFLLESEDIVCWLQESIIQSARCGFMLPQAIQNEAYALSDIGIIQNGFVVGFVNVAFKRQKRGDEFVQLKARLQNSAINVS